MSDGDGGPPRRFGAYGNTVVTSSDGGMCWDRLFDVGPNLPVTSKQVAAALNAQAAWQAGEPVPDIVPGP